MSLPSGIKTVEDEMIIDYLSKDPVFIESMEITLGKIIRIYPDWDTRHLVYELLDGNIKESKIDGVLVELKKMNYLKEFEH